MTFWRYKSLELLVSLVVFVASLPVLYLAAVFLLRSVAVHPAYLLLPLLIIWVIGCLTLTVVLTEKLSKRWSR